MKERFEISLISWCVSIGWLVTSFNSSLLTLLAIPTEKNFTPLFFNGFVNHLVISIPRELKPSVTTTTTFFTPFKRRKQERNLLDLWCLLTCSRCHCQVLTFSRPQIGQDIIFLLIPDELKNSFYHRILYIRLNKPSYEKRGSF